MLQMPDERLPVFQEIIAGLAQAGFGEPALPQPQGDLLQPIELAGVMLFAMPQAVRDGEAVFIPEGFAFVEPADDDQDQPDGLGVLLFGLKNFRRA